MSSAQPERRGSLRLSVGIPIRAQIWKSVLPDRYAELLNVSETGAYFATWSRFREGDILDLYTTIQTTAWLKSTEWRRRAEVVRVQALDSSLKKYGIAVRFARAEARQSRDQRIPCKASA